MRGPCLQGGKPSHLSLARLPLASLVARRYMVRRLHSGAGLQRSRMGKLGGWLVDGTLVEVADGAMFCFSSASQLSLTPGGAALALVVSGG